MPTRLDSDCLQGSLFPDADSGMPVSLGELFCGAGGMALGAALNGRFGHAWAIDNNPDACATFESNITARMVSCQDVRDVDFASLPDIDGLVGGFPCNDFSKVGKQKGRAGEYGVLYKAMVDCLKAKQPKFFVAENVSGLSSSGDDLQVIVEDMRQVGYDVFCHTYKFEMHGVPQRRHRIIFTGWRQDLNVTSYEQAPYTCNEPVTASEALEGIPANAANHEMPSHSPIVTERLSLIQPGQNVFNANLPERLRLNYRSGVLMSHMYRKLRPDRPAHTVTGSGGGGTSMYHWSENRALTNRERARLQTFPDWFAFTGGLGSVRKQIGMAVPPVGAAAVFARVVEQLDKLV